MSVVRDIEFTQIAADWDSITLGEEDPQALLVMRNGLTVKQVQNNGEYKVSRIETIGDGWIDDTRVRFASGLEEKDVAKHLLQKGDILFSHINSDRHLGKTGFAERDYDDLLHGMNLLLIRANPAVFDPEFLNRVFQYYRDIGVFIAICSRAVNQSSINQAKMKALELPLPPLPEQKKVAHVLSTVQRAIEAQERIIQTTTELKKTLMHKLFTEGTRGEPQKETEIGPIPESWEVMELGKHCRVQSGFAFRSKDYVKGDGGIPITKIGDIQNGGVIYTEKSSYVSEKFWDDRRFDQFQLQVGDVLIALTGATTGKSGVFQHQQRAFLNQRAGRFLPDDVGLTRSFMPFLVLQPYFQNEINSNILVAAQGNISPKRIEKIKISLPKPDVQEEVASMLNSLDRKITGAQAKQNAFGDLFRTLLYELMTAKIRVHEVDV